MVRNGTVSGYLAALLVLVAPDLFGQSGFNTSGKPVTQQVKDDYKERVCEFSTESTGSGTSPTNLVCVFALADDQAWGFFSSVSSLRAEKQALQHCRQVSSMPTSCRIVDTNRESEFIKTGQRYAGVATPTTYRGKICFEEFHKDSGRIWRNFIDIGTHPFLSPGECDAYVSADRLTWIGSTDSINAQTNPDSLRVLTKLGTTQEQYDECYATVHATNLMLEGRTFKNWQRVVKQSQGVNDDSVATPLILKCKPFLSADYLTWTAPLPGDATAKGSEVIPPVLISLDRTQQQYDECYSTVHRMGPINLNGRIFPSWNSLVEHAQGGTNIHPDAAALTVLCSPFLSSDYLVWKAPLADQFQEESTEANLANVTSETEAVAIDLEYWQSVKDSGDADMLRAYLRKFPGGKFKVLAEIKLRKLN